MNVDDMPIVMVTRAPVAARFADGVALSLHFSPPIYGGTEAEFAAQIEGEGELRHVALTLAQARQLVGLLERARHNRAGWVGTAGEVERGN